MAKALTLLYRRVDADLCTGGFFTTGAHNQVEALSHFSRFTYIDMMKSLAAYLGDPSFTAVFTQRTDRPMLAVQQMSTEELELFRTDPASAIRARTFPTQTVSLRPPPAENPPLKAGYETLVDALGEEVCVRTRFRREYEVECPGCGRWAPIGASGLDFKCAHCALTVAVTMRYPQSAWASIRAESLFESGHPKFFFPRAWNPYGNWITRDQFNDLYVRYLKEK